MSQKRLAIFSSSEVPDLPRNEGFLPKTLAAHGIAADVLLWDRPFPDLRSYDAVLVRSIWGYYRDIDAYQRFLGVLAAGGQRVQNSVSFLRWNAHKFYLRDLSEKGVDLVPTTFLSAKPTQDDLEQARFRFQTNGLVLKPAISASAHHTIRLGAGEAITDHLPDEGDWLLQPYMPEVESEGEWSIIFFAGRYSHAVRKVARPGDFRVQHEYGGRCVAAEAGADLRRQAQAVLAALPDTPLMARVDGLVRDGRFLLMELELIEPDLLLLTEHARQNYLEVIIAFARGDKWQ